MSEIKKTDIDAIRKLAKIVAENGLTEIEIVRKDETIRVAKEPAIIQQTAMAQAPAMIAPVLPTATSVIPVEEKVALDPADNPGTVKSPMVGTAYLSPQPGASNFVRPGDEVSEGQTLLIVEAMKVMNPIVAPQAGVVKEILITDSQPVEFDEPLVILA